MFSSSEASGFKSGALGRYYNVIMQLKLIYTKVYSLEWS